ncbi:MAG: single-stranded DNA-binding protein [Bacteroidales bacterium]|nr:single-stranded DNA-binding protein [Bacteroidales bacterium]MDE7465992.1 single-stranded DNA-binding protein [Muribaculaceae bacterium]
MSVNKVILLGNVGRDPEIRYPEKDFPVAYLSLATNERNPGSQLDITEWHILVLTGQNALFAEKYIRKGTRLYVEGKLRTREYTDKFKIARRRTEIYVDTLEILGRQ